VKQGRRSSDPVDYSDGAVKISIDLGFSDHYDLEDWADENPELWGNKYGSLMFMGGGSHAFTPGSQFKAHNLKDIIDHWKEVKERLPK